MGDQGKTGEQPAKELKILQQQVSVYEAVFDNMKNAVAIYKAVDGGKDFVFKKINHASERIERLRNEDIAGKRVTKVFPGIKEFGLLDVFRRVWKTGKAEEHPVVQYKDDRISGWRRNYVYKLPAGDIVAIYEDVTESKKYEKMLEKAKQEAEQASRTKSQFLANMSHEIRTPMNAIMGFADLLKETKITAEQKGYIDTILESGELLVNIINDILDLSKIEAGEIRLEEIVFDLKEVIKSLVSMVEHMVKDKAVDLTFEYPEDIPTKFKGDPTRVKQVIINLLNNAAKFTEKGYIKILVSSEQPDIHDIGKERIIKIIVKDSGIGIPAEKQKQVFSAFSQADFSSTRKYGGTGLGLFIVKRLLNLMGGSIELDSRENKGSEFTVRFTVQEGDGDIGHIKKEFDEDRKTEISVSFSGKKVLIVEDDAVNSKLINILLRKTGIITDSAFNGKEACEKSRTTDYDLILMDLSMPVKDGFEAAQDIRKNISKNVPIIALSAYSSKPDEKKAFDCGMNDFIHKPINHEDFIRKIAKWLGGMG